jgi:hypothetical protein
MEVKFSDLVTMIEQIAKDVVTLKGLPKKERQKALELIDETYRLLDQAILLITTRLSDVLLEAPGKGKMALAYELERLANGKEWLELERDVRLCRSLSTASIEWRRLSGRLGQRLTLHDRPGFNLLVDDILEGERSLADFISRELRGLSKLAETSITSAADRKNALTAVRVMRDALYADRRMLIEAQVASYSLI